MGAVQFRSLDDLAKWRADLRVTCPKCRHEAVFNAGNMIGWFREKRWSTSLDVAPYRFRCSECGNKPCKLSAIMPEGKLPPERPRPKAAATAPTGIDPEAWANADQRERKKLIERLR